MKISEGTFIGIMGTIIVHLIVAIIFMSFKLHAIKKIETESYIVEFLPSELEEKEEEKIEMPESSLEKIFEGDENMLNIARNIANKPDIKVDPDEYIDMVKDELINSGLLDKNNFIDAQKKMDELSPEDNIALEELTHKEEQPTESQKMEANYSGPTRIYYDLEGRNHTYLPIPIYKCEGSGIVALSIEVNQKGITDRKSVV